MKSSQILIGGALVMLVTACGSNAPSGSPSSSSTQAPSARASTPAQASAPNLTAELLGINDLPAVWSVVPNSDSGEPRCLDNLRSDLKAISRVEMTFVGGSSGLPVLEESLFYGPGHGPGDMAVVSRILSACGPISMTTGGQTLKGALRPLTFPAVADQSFAYQMNLSGTVSGQSVIFVVDLVAFRKANTVAIILYANIGGSSTQALQPIVQNAAAKLS